MAKPTVIRYLLLTRGPCDWAFRYRDLFQVVPAREPDIPRAAAGDNAHAWLEISYNTSEDPVQLAPFIVRLLSLLSDSRFRVSGQHFGWFVPYDRPNETPIFGREPYPVAYAKYFTDTASDREIELLHRAPGSLRVRFEPNIAQLCCAAFGLKGKDREMFRSCLTLYHAAWQAPIHSLRLLICFAIMEGLAKHVIPPGNREKRELVHQLARKIDLALDDALLKRLYDSRNALVHDGELRLLDDILNKNIDERFPTGTAPVAENAAAQELVDTPETRRIARELLVGWLRTSR